MASQNVQWVVEDYTYIAEKRLDLKPEHILDLLVIAYDLNQEVIQIDDKGEVVDD